MKKMNNSTFIKKIFAFKNEKRIPIICDEVFIQLSPERRLKVLPHLEKNSVVFHSICVNEQEEPINDRHAQISLDLGCSNKVNLTVNDYEIRLGYRLINIPHYGYPKVFSIKENKKSIIFEATQTNRNANMLIIQFDNERELMIECFQNWETIMLEAYCINEANEKSSDKFARLEFQPTAANRFHLKIVAAEV